MKYAVLLLALMFAGCGGCSSTDGGYETFTIAGETMQVAKEDFPSMMNWYDAKAACQNLGNGWRLPSKEELGAMYEQMHKRGKGKFDKHGWYWSSSEYKDDLFQGYWAVSFFFFNGQASSYSEYLLSGGKDGSKHVRAVRTLP